MLVVGSGAVLALGFLLSLGAICLLGFQRVCWCGSLCIYLCVCVCESGLCVNLYVCGQFVPVYLFMAGPWPLLEMVAGSGGFHSSALWDRPMLSATKMCPTQTADRLISVFKMQRQCRSLNLAAADCSEGEQTEALRLEISGCYEDCYTLGGFISSCNYCITNRLRCCQLHRLTDADTCLKAMD